MTHSDFLYEFKNYPPELICYIKEKKFQIILDFDNYFSDTDYQTIREYGKENNITILSIHLPNIESLASFEELEKYIDTSEHKKWIYNLRGENLVKLWDENYSKIAKPAVPFRDGYLCPAQKSKCKNVYYAKADICNHCQYCYKYNRNENEIKCTAGSYINNIEDFSKTEAELKKQFNEVNHVKTINKIEEYSCPKCGGPMVKRRNKDGYIFAGCKKYPNCKGTRSVVKTTGEVIIEEFS